MPISRKKDSPLERLRQREKRATNSQRLNPLRLQSGEAGNDSEKFPDNNPHPVLMIHKNGTILYANKAGKDLIKPKDDFCRAELRKLVRKAIKSGQIERCETQYNNRFFIFSAVPILNRNYVNLYGTDVTGHKNEKAALEKELREIRTIIDSLPIIVFYKDKKGRFIRANKTFSVSLKIPEKSFFGKTVFDIYSRHIAQKMAKDDREVLRTGQPKLNIIEQYESATGPRWVQTSKFPIFDNADQLAGLVGFAQDITEQKLAEEELKKSEAKLLNAVKIAKLGYWEYDIATDMFTFNDQFYSIFRTTAEKVGGYKISSARYAEMFIPPEDRHAVGIEVKKALEAAKPDFSSQLEHRIIYADGEIGYIAVRFFIVKDSCNRTIRTYGANQDITERKMAEQALRISEERLNAAANAAELGIWDWNLISGKINWAGHHTKLFGLKEGEFDGRYETFEKIIHPQDKAGVNAAIKNALTNKSEYSHEYRIVQPNGGIRWIYGKGNFIFDNTGRAVRMVGAVYDITERRKINEETQKERDFAKKLLETAQTIVLVLDPMGKIVSFNPYMEEISGYKLEEVLGFDWFTTFVPERHREYIRDLFKKATSDIQTKGNVNPILTKDGTEIEIEWYDKTLKDEHGNIIGLLSIGQDITKRKIAEEKLQQERNLLRALFDHIPDAVYVKDKEGRFIACNKIVSDYWGITNPTEIIGKTDFDFYDKNKAHQFFEEEQKIISTGKPLINRDGMCTYESGEEHYVLTTKVPLRDGLGNITGIVGINRDITERKHNEEKLLEYQKQLKKLASQVTLAEERQRRKIAGLLHDQIGQSLALAKIKLETIQISMASSLIFDDLKSVCDEIEKTIEIIRSLTFDLSYPVLYELGLEAAIAEWLNEKVASQYGIAVDFISDNKPKPLNDDMKVMLFRNVRELLYNAIKHSKADKVKVSVNNINNMIQVAVEDNGVGFDPVEIKKTAAKKGKFGLFSIRESIEPMGGCFEIESKPGAGCRTVITVPFNQQTLEKEKQLCH